MTPDLRGPSIFAGAGLVAARELRELTSSRQILFQVAVFTLAVPIALGYWVARFSAGIPLPIVITTQVAVLPFVSAVQATLQAFAGERAERTLAPLLATPLHNLSIFLGKAASCLVPAALLSCLALGLFTATASSQGVQVDFRRDVWLVIALALATGSAFVVAGIAASTKAPSVKGAQASSALLVFPLFGAAVFLANKLQDEPVLVLGACYLAMVPIGFTLAAVAKRWRREEAILRGS